MLRKLAVLLLWMALIVPLVGCGGTADENEGRGNTAMQQKNYESAAGSYRSALNKARKENPVDRTKVARLEEQLRKSTEMGEDSHRLAALADLTAAKAAADRRDWTAMAGKLADASDHAEHANDPALTQEVDALFKSRPMLLARVDRAYSAMCSDAGSERFKNFFGIPGKRMDSWSAKGHARGMVEIAREIGDAELLRHAQDVDSNYRSYIAWKRRQERAQKNGGSGLLSGLLKWSGKNGWRRAQAHFEDRLEVLIAGAQLPAIHYTTQSRYPEVQAAAAVTVLASQAAEPAPAVYSGSDAVPPAGLSVAPAAPQTPPSAAAPVIAEADRNTPDFGGVEITR